MKVLGGEYEKFKVKRVDFGDKHVNHPQII